MIKSIGFSGFRSFPEGGPLQRIELLPITILIGGNNSGKTSICDMVHSVIAELAGYARKLGLPSDLNVSMVVQGKEYQEYSASNIANGIFVDVTARDSIDIRYEFSALYEESKAIKSPRKLDLNFSDILRKAEGISEVINEETVTMARDWLRENAILSTEDLKWELSSGITTLLPVLILQKWRQSGGLRLRPFVDIIQQPELSLNNSLHPALGDLFVETALDTEGITIIETHSEGLLLRVRRRIAEGKIDPDIVALYHVSRDKEGSSVKRIMLDSNGEVDWWPEGVFSESFEEVKALRRAQRRNE